MKTIVTKDLEATVNEWLNRGFQISKIETEKVEMTFSDPTSAAAILAPEVPDSAVVIIKSNE